MDEKAKKIIKEYIDTFGNEPPQIWGVELDNEKYLEMLEDAIDFNEELTKDELSKEFYKDSGAQY